MRKKKKGQLPTQVLVIITNTKQACEGVLVEHLIELTMHTYKCDLILENPPCYALSWISRNTNLKYSSIIAFLCLIV